MEQQEKLEREGRYQEQPTPRIMNGTNHLQPVQDEGDSDYIQDGEGSEDGEEAYSVSRSGEK